MRILEVGTKLSQGGDCPSASDILHSAHDKRFFDRVIIDRTVPSGVSLRRIGNC